jgi:hypothetical protein
MQLKLPQSRHLIPWTKHSIVEGDNPKPPQKNFFAFSLLRNEKSKVLIVPSRETLSSPTTVIPIFCWMPFSRFARVTRIEGLHLAVVAISLLLIAPVTLAYVGCQDESGKSVDWWYVIAMEFLLRYSILRWARSLAALFCLTRRSIFGSTFFGISSGPKFSCSTHRCVIHLKNLLNRCIIFQMYRFSRPIRSICAG